MAKIKTILGLIWAVAAVLAIPAAFMSSDALTKKLVYASGMKISPVYTGGDVARTVDHADYSTTFYKPVFACLIGESKNGFIQIVWTAKTKLPGSITEKVDIDGDGKDDFTLTADTSSKTAVIDTPQNGIAAKVMRVYSLKNGMAVRVSLRK